MLRAAQLRAQGRSWGQIADALDLKPSTVKGYPSKYPPFETSEHADRQGLVGWYRDQIWAEEVERLVRRIQPSSLEALLEVIEHDGKGDDEGPRWSTVVQAAHKALKTTGFEERQKTRGALEEQESVTGEPGERVNVHRPDASDEDVLDAAELLVESEDEA